MKRIAILFTITASCMIFLVTTLGAIVNRQVSVPVPLKVTASDADAGDKFGDSVASDKDTLVVGAPYDDDRASDAGAIYIYALQPDGNWQLVKKATASDGTPGSLYGGALALQENTLAVAAPKAVGQTAESGAVYILYRHHGGTNNWGEIAKVIAPDGAPVDRFGWRVAIDGDTVVVGTRLHDGAGLDAGAAYVFERDYGGLNNWGQVAKLTASDASAKDWFGISVDIFRDTIVVGAAGADATTKPGKAYVFERNPNVPTDWNEIKILTASDGAAKDKFGGAVAVSDETVIVGALRDDDAGSESGSAYVFVRNLGGANNWGELAKLAAADANAGDRFGKKIALNDDLVLITAQYGDGQSINSGAAYVFKRDENGNWSEILKLLAPDGEPNDYFGAGRSSVAINQGYLVIGAYGDDDACPTNPNCESGSAYIFDLTPDLTIRKSAIQTDTLPGAPVTYTFTFSNSGGITLTQAVITDQVPTLVTQPAFTSSFPLVVTGTTPFVWQLSDLEPGAGGVITVTGITSPGLSADTVITNTAVFATEFIAPSVVSDTAILTVTVPRLHLAQQLAPVPEATITVPVTVTVNVPNPFADVTVAYETLPGSATPSFDYISVSGTLTLPAGTVEATVLVPILDDTLTEDEETLLVRLYNPAGALVHAPITTTVGIAANDPPGFHAYLPLVTQKVVVPAFPLYVGDAIPARPVTFAGEVFYTATLQIPSDLPQDGRFFFSASPNSLAPVVVDDELVVSAGSVILYRHQFATASQPPVAATLEISRSLMTLVAGNTITITYQDVYGNLIGASPIWIIWVPPGR